MVILIFDKKKLKSMEINKEELHEKIFSFVLYAIIQHTVCRN